MKHLLFFSLLSCIALSGFSQDKIQHALSVGAQMPADDVLPMAIGRVLVRQTAFPVTLRYAAMFRGQHQVGLTLGGRMMPDQRIVIGPTSQFSNSSRSFESRIDYRWFVLGTEKRFQPFIGVGFLRTDIFFGSIGGMPPRNFTTNTFQGIAGLRFRLSDRFFLSTELPFSFGNVWEGSLAAVQERDNPNSAAIGAMWYEQRNQLWPVISVGLNL